MGLLGEWRGSKSRERFKVTQAILLSLNRTAFLTQVESHLRSEICGCVDWKHRQQGKTFFSMLYEESSWLYDIHFSTILYVTYYSVNTNEAQN